jgi:hypothetical protein
MSVNRPPGAGVGTEVAAGTKAGPLAAYTRFQGGERECGQSVAPENTEEEEEEVEEDGQ